MLKKSFFKQCLHVSLRIWPGEGDPCLPDLITATPCIMAWRLELTLAPLVTRMKWAGSHHTETASLVSQSGVCWMIFREESMCCQKRTTVEPSEHQRSTGYRLTSHSRPIPHSWYSKLTTARQTAQIQQWLRQKWSRSGLWTHQRAEMSPEACRIP